MKKILYISLFIISNYLSSQNLILNGDFEDNLKDTLYINNYVNGKGGYYFDTMISSYVKGWEELYGFNFYINSSLYSENPIQSYKRTKFVKSFKNKACINVMNTYWYSIGIDSLATLCPFNSPFGKYCRGYGGIYQKLSAPLKIDTQYIISFRFKIGDSNRIKGLEKETPFNILSNFGVRFSTFDTTSLLLPDSIPYLNELQDTILDTTYRWRIIERAFVADSLYTSVAFTQFSIDKLKYRLYYVDTNSTTGIPNVFGVDFETYIDDIRLLPTWQYLKVSNDTTICSGDSVVLKVISGSGNHKWFIAGSSNNILSYSNTLKIKVDTTTMFQVMSPYDTASIMVYTSPLKYQYDTILYQSCNNQSFKISVPNIIIWNDNTKDTAKNISQSGIYWYQTKNHCDIKKTHILSKIGNNNLDSFNIVACNRYKWIDSIFSETGIYLKNLKNINNCDSLIILNLTILKSKYDTINAETCNSFKFGDSIYSKTGIYTQKYTSKNGCDSFSTLILTSKEVTGKIKLENGINYTALTPNASYQWYYCYPWSRITNAQNQTFSTTTKGSYAVVVSSLGCTDTSDCVALYSSGIQSLNQNNIQIYPNPVKDNFTIQIGSENKENSVEIYNALGQKIKSFNTKLNEIQIDMKEEANGIYLVRINELHTFKISKN